MRKINLIAVAAALILTASTPRASVAAPIGVQVDPFQIMINTKDLSTVRYQDFSLVFD
jgi:phosphate-selective porin